MFLQVHFTFTDTFPLSASRIVGPFQVFIPETSSSTDVRASSVHLPDSSSVAQSTSVSSVSTVTQSILVSESAQVMVHSSAVSDGGMMVSDSTASTSSDLGSAIDKIIESTIGPDIMNGEGVQGECVFFFIGALTTYSSTLTLP